MKSTKLSCMLLSAAMLMGLMAGCGNGDASSSPAASTASEASTAAAPTETAVSEAAPAASEEDSTIGNATDADMAKLTAAVADEAIITFPLEDRVEFSYFIAPEGDGAELMDSYADNLVMKTAEAETNVAINFREVSFLAVEEQFNLMLASGDLPDIIQGFGEYYTKGLDHAIEEDLIVDLTGYLEDGYAPNFAAIRNSNKQIARETATDSGTVGSFYFLIGDADEGPRAGLWLRQDWLEALNLEVPTTFDEMENVLTAFKDEYNPKMPLLLTSDGFFSSYVLMGGYDVSASFYNQDGVVKYGPIEDGMRDYLEMMHRWYEEGLITSDFISTSEFSLMFDATPIVSDQCGVWNANYRGDDSWKDSAADPNFTPLAIKDMTKTGTEQIHVGGRGSNVNRYGVVVSAACQDPETCVAWCDWWYSDEATLLSSYGIEGETFNYNEDGQPIYTDMILNNDLGSMRAMRNVYTGMSLAFRVLRIVTSGVDNGYDIIDRGTWDSNRDNAWDISSYISRTAEEGDEYSAIMSDIETYVDQQIPAFITGESDLADWDTYVANIKNLNIDEAIAIQQAAVDRFENR